MSGAHRVDSDQRWPSEETAAAVRDWLKQRPPGQGQGGRLPGPGPLEDAIHLIEVRVRGHGQDADFEIVFEHRAFPGKRFGLRTGPLWRPLPGDADSWLDREEPQRNGFRLGSWAEDFPTLDGLPSDQAPGPDGVIWIPTTYRDQLTG